MLDHHKIVQEVLKEFNEECEIAVKELLAIAGVEVYQEDRELTPSEAQEELKKKGFSIVMFNEQHKVQETFIVLHKDGEYVTGAVVGIDFDLNVIKRTMIPISSGIKEKFNTLIKGMKQ